MAKLVIKKRKAGKSGKSATVEAEYARLHRVLKILQLIQGQDGWTAGSLARDCGVNERTIYRDLGILQGAGIPFFFDEEKKCYRIRGDFFMKPIELKFDEALAIIALGEHIGQNAQIPFTQAAARAVAKIRTQLPERLRRELEAIDHHMVIRLGQAADQSETVDVYDKVQAAQASHTCLRCQYESNEKGYTKPFMFKPYKLLFERRAWYVIGYHGAHDEVRCLKLNRFTRVESTDMHFDVPADFNLKKHFGNAWRMIRGKKRYEVELWFDPKFAENIADTHWHDTQEITWLDDGAISFKCKVDGLEEILWWVLSMGPNCKVIEPAELATRVKELAQQTAAVYGK